MEKSTESTPVKCEIIESKPFRREISRFFTLEDWPYETTITEVSVKESDDMFEVKIVSHRPSLLIGKSGNLIDSLRKFLNEKFDKEVKIRLEECMLWSNLY